MLPRRPDIHVGILSTMGRTEVSDHLNIRKPGKYFSALRADFIGIYRNLSGIYFPENPGFYWNLSESIRIYLESIFLSSEHVSDDRPSVRPMGLSYGVSVVR